MAFLKFSEIVDLNKILNENNFACKVHLHDACGKQFFSLETTDKEIDFPIILEFIKNYFSEKNIEIIIGIDNKSFYLK
jgi:hypothetical protein